MEWAEVTIHTTQEAVEIVTNLLHEAGSNGVAIEDSQDLVKPWSTPHGELYELNPDHYPKTGVRVKAYFPADEHLEQKIANIRHAVEQLEDKDLHFGEKTVTVLHIDDEDWSTAWKKYYKPIRISENILIKPRWEHYERTASEELIITLDPGMAFGTGSHQTTVLCLRAIEKYVSKNDIVVDVGTGSGILSIAAAKLGAKAIFAYDNDPVAVSSAAENVRLNNVQTQVHVQTNDLLHNVDVSAQLVVANLLANLVIQLTDKVIDILEKEGYFIVSGMIRRQEQMVVDHLTSFGFLIVETMYLDDWIAIVAKYEGAE